MTYVGRLFAKRRLGIANGFGHNLCGANMVGMNVINLFDYWESDPVFSNVRLYHHVHVVVDMHGDFEVLKTRSGTYLIDMTNKDTVLDSVCDLLGLEQDKLTLTWVSDHAFEIDAYDGCPVVTGVAKYE